MNYIEYMSPIGKLTIVSEGDNLIGLWIENQKYFCEILYGDQELINKETPILKKTKEWLDKYFNNEKPELYDLNIKFIGTDFRKLVWNELIKISYGEVTTYKTLSEKIAKKLNKKFMSPQAIGNAVSHNPISIIVPCHRVVGTNGSLTGYAGGLNVKEKLLNFERGNK